MTVLITGSSGILGSELKKILHEALAPFHTELDITHVSQVDKYISRTQVETIIHCAAKTSVRWCDSNREQAFIINVQATRELFHSLCKHAQRKAYFVYISTACVFPGDDAERLRYYSEEDVPFPKNFYALSKLLGECAVNEISAKFGADALVIRTNFVERGKWKYPSAFKDRFGTYLYSDQVAKAIESLVEKRTTGLIHVCSDKRMSMYELAHLTDPDVKPMTLQEYSGPAVTINMSLKSTRIAPIKFKS